MWIVNKKIHIDIDGNKELVKIIYDKKLKSKKQALNRGYAPHFIVVRVPENTTDKEIEERLNKPYYKKWLKEQKQLYPENNNIYEAEVLRLGFKLEERTLDELKEIVTKYINKYKNKFPNVKKVQYKPINGVWGRCNNNKDTLTFNPVLKYLSEEYIEHIVYHEMVHTYCLNHNPPFQRKMIERYPNWRQMEFNFTFWIYLLNKNDIFF